MNTETVTVPSIGEIIRKAEDDYISGTTQISKYVPFQMRETLDRIDAYLNSKHTSGEKDALGRDKPFFNIVTAAVNVWFRATDIDRSNIKIRAGKKKDWLDSFVATQHLRDWMRKARFGQFLNEWGRVLSRYGSSVVKFIETNGELYIFAVPWNMLIIDAVDFASNPKIEILELTEAELRRRIKTHGYRKQAVDDLVTAAKTERETLERKKKDSKAGYYKLYELHGELPLSLITKKPEDNDEHVQQMHIISFVGTKNGRKTEYKDFTLYDGREARDPYMLTHLIKEEGRSLSIGAVEHLFDAQWMVNHSVKSIKDQLDIASKLAFQTADGKFVGKNILTDFENGDIFVHGINMPLTQVNNQGHDIVSSQNFAVMWKGLGNEINGISEAMLGTAPKSGTAWRQTEALLNESYSLFEIMTENKGLSIEDMMREFILPFIRRNRMDTADEIAATLNDHELRRIDSLYLKVEATKKVNDRLKKQLIQGVVPTPESQQAMMGEEQEGLGDELRPLANQRFFTPSELSDKTWKEQFKDLEWEVEVEVTGEDTNVQEALTTLNSALKLILTPGFEQNERAKAIVGRILEMTGAMSPVEYNAITPAAAAPALPGQPQPAPAAAPLA